MQSVKYQIFISSTYEDLKEERDQVIKACLEMGHIPVGMEMFSAADEEQWQIIKKQIDSSDYYIVIIANRYGSIVDGISYTEKEYDYALANGIPILGFIIADSVDVLLNKTDQGPDAQDKKLRLADFKDKVKLKPIKRWSNKDQLFGFCSTALSKAFNTNPRPGWIRTTETTGPEVAAELSRLSLENAKLRDENEILKKSAEGLSFAQGNDTLSLDFTVTSGYYSGREVQNVSIETTWNKVLVIVGSAILEDLKIYQIKDRIESGFRDKIISYIHPSSEPDIFPNSIMLSEEDFEKVRNQFMALGYIRVKLALNEWELVPKGQKIYAGATAIERRNKDISN